MGKEPRKALFLFRIRNSSGFVKIQEIPGDILWRGTKGGGTAGCMTWDQNQPPSLLYTYNSVQKRYESLELAEKTGPGVIRDLCPDGLKLLWDPNRYHITLFPAHHRLSESNLCLPDR